MPNGIYAFIPKERLDEVLSTLQEFIHTPVSLLDPDGAVLQQYGIPATYCTLLKQTVFSENSCCYLHAQAGRHAQTLGEAYIFTCHADLNLIAYPLIQKNELLGTILIGPFLFQKPDSMIISILLDEHNLSAGLAIELLDQLTNIRVLPPNRASVLKKMLDQLLSTLLPTERLLMIQKQEKMGQQSQINETIQLFKQEHELPALQLFYDKETELLAKIRTGDIASAKSLLNEWIAYDIYSTGGAIRAVKNHVMELATLFSRAVLDSGVSADIIYSMNSEYITQIMETENLDDLSYLLQNILENYMNVMYNEIDGSNPYIRKALLHIANHYNQSLTIASTAEMVGLSPNHFSALFQKAVGMKFHDYLCRIRVEESKRLLLSTDLSLTDIAIASGFPDQSYFCKVFKKIVGVPPGQFRNR